MEDLMKKKVLVVDDDLGTVALVTKHLQDAGFEVQKSTNGQEALASVKQDRPDLIIIDRMMPKMDGVKACALLKADRRFCSIPVIMMTVSAEMSDRQLSEQVGADVFINKPLNMADLVGKIQELIRRG